MALRSALRICGSALFDGNRLISRNVPEAIRMTIGPPHGELVDRCGGAGSYVHSSV